VICENGAESHVMLNVTKYTMNHGFGIFYEAWNQIQSFIGDVFMVIGYSIMNTLQVFLMNILIHNLFNNVHCIFSPFRMVYICNLNLNTYELKQTKALKNCFVVFCVLLDSNTLCFLVQVV
jgi:hypothetical protein